MSPLAGLRHFIASHTEMSSANAGHVDEYPPLPSSLNAHDHELRNCAAEQSDYKTHPNTAPRYTPYIGLGARLSQTWINKWTILLLLVLFRVLLAVKDMDRDIADAKADALSACTSVEGVGSALASMPHYMSAGVNAMAADGVTSAVDGFSKMLQLIVTGVEELVLFYINMLTSTYVCLISLVIDGSLHVAIEMIEGVENMVNKTIDGITSTISSDLSSFEKDLNGFLKDIGDVTGLFGGSKDPPSINLTSEIDALNNIHINTSSLDGDLTRLSNHIPTFAQVQNFTDNLISLPFEDIKKLINESMSNFTFDKSVFPVAQKQELTFCSDNNSINDFFDGLSDVAHIARKVFIAVVTIAAILACIPMAYAEIRGWRTMQQRAQLLQSAAFDRLDVLYIASRPYTSTAGIKAASTFKSSKRQILTRWTVAYATTIPALFVLALGVAGLLAVLCQYILLKAIEKEVPVLTAEVSNYAGEVVGALNNASEAWATSANGVIESLNTKINNDVFGWVNTSTTAVNNTLNGFVNEYTGVLNTTFGGTILYDPVMQTINCLIGLKISSIEAGLTWVHNNAHVTFPEFANDTFSLGASEAISNSSSSNASLSSSAVTSNEITGAVAKMVDAIQAGIWDEFAIALTLVGLWFFILLIGIIRALICMSQREKTRAEGGAAYAGEQHGPAMPRSADAADRKFPAFDGAVSAHPDTQRHDDYETWGPTGLGLTPMSTPPPPFVEKIGHVGKRSVGTVEVAPAHVRSSSYGFVSGDEKS